MTTTRTRAPLVADEATMLLGWLDHHRDTLRLKAAGLDAEQLATAHPPSTLTLGGLLKHLAMVEDFWFGVVLLGQPEAEPWRDVDWEADPDWEFHSAVDDGPERLLALFDESVAASDRIVHGVLADGGLDRLAVRKRHGGHPSLRWILVHMIEEYARHNGHADLIREAVDGSTGT